MAIPIAVVVVVAAVVVVVVEDGAGCNVVLMGSELLDWEMSEVCTALHNDKCARSRKKNSTYPPGVRPGQGRVELLGVP